MLKQLIKRGLQWQKRMIGFSFVLFLLLVMNIMIRCKSDRLTLLKVGKIIEKIENNQFSQADLMKLQSDIDNRNEIDLQQLALLLPVELRSGIRYKDTRYAYFSGLLNKKDSLQFINVREDIEHLIRDDALSTFLKIEAYKLHASISKIINKELINEINQTNYNQMSEIELYQHLRLMSDISSILLNKYMEVAGLSVLHKALYIIETDTRAKKYIKIKSTLIKNKLKYFINQRKKEYNSVVPDLINLYTQLIDCEDQLYIIKRLQTYIKPDSSLQLKTINQISKMNISLADKLFLITDLGLALLNQNPVEAIECFRISKTMTRNVSCSIQKNIIDNYLIYAYLLNGDKETARSIFNNLERNACSPYTNNYSRYYDILTNIMLLEQGENSRAKKEIRNLYNQQLQLADTIFSDSYSEHLGDYYTDVTFSILKKYQKDEYNISSKEIVNFIYAAKNRAIRIASNNDDQFTKRQDKKLLNEALLIVNDFKELLPFDHPAYLKISEQILINPQLYFSDQYYHKPHLDFNVIEQKRSRNELDLITFLYHNGNYFLYKITEGENELHYVESLDSLIWSARNTVSKTYNRGLDEIRKELSPFIDNHTIIFPDGPLTLFPVHLLSTKYNTTTHYDIGAWSKDKRNNLCTHNSTILSYSDSASIFSNEVKSFPELKYGYGESKEIKALLPGSQLFSGEDCSIENLVDYGSQDLLHLTTHASSDINNRLLNYIILKKGESVERVFGYEIKSRKINPMCLFLTTCESGYGKHIDGLGTFSLSRSFLENGTQTIIKSLWKINDYASKEFMVYLYHQWTSGISLGDALHRTRIHFRDGRQAPMSEWAGFVLEGNPEMYLNVK